VTNETITRRIAKLLDLANRKAGNEAEAQAAAAKAQELLLRHNLDLADVEGRIDDDGDPLVEDTKVQPGQRTRTWERDLFFKVCHGFNCRGLYTSPNRWSKTYQYHFVGRRSSVEVAQYMFEYLKNALNDVAAKAWKESKAEIEEAGAYQVNGRTWKYDFLMGAVRSIGERFYQEKERFKQESVKGRAMIRVSGTEVDLFVKDKYPRLTFCRSARDTLCGDARARGREAGNSLPLRRGVTNDPKRQLGG
jgi:hypothetical protein